MKSDINAPGSWYEPGFVPTDKAEYLLKNSLNTYVFQTISVIVSREDCCLMYGQARSVDQAKSTPRLLFIHKENKTVHLHMLTNEIKEFDETSLAVAIGMLKLGILPSEQYLY
jgi:hypothetical protein